MKRSYGPRPGATGANPSHQGAHFTPPMAPGGLAGCGGVRWMVDYFSRQNPCQKVFFLFEGCLPGTSGGC